MSLLPGQAFKVKAFFANGFECNYPRPFLVIENNGNFITALNISSTKGKEHKLLFKSNKRVVPHDPPFPDPSMVKLDEVYTFEMCDEIPSYLMRSGRGMSESQLSTVKNWYNDYLNDNEVLSVHIAKNDFLSRNNRPQRS